MSARRLRVNPSPTLVNPDKLVYAMRELLFFTLFATAFLACTDKEATLRGRLAALDKEFGGAAVTDTSKAQEFIVTAEQLASIVEKSDTNQSVELLLKAAGLAKTVGSFDKSLALYKTVTERFSQHPQASTAFFMVGFVYANDLRELEKGKAAYELFLEKYPNDPMAESARGEIRNLGRPADEIIKDFMQNNPDSTLVN